MAATAEATRNPGGDSGTADTISLTAAIAAIESFLAHCEPGCYSGVDAEALVKRFAQIEHLGAAGKTLFARRAADANMARAGGHRDDAEYLAALTGESKGEAEGTLRLGSQLQCQPGVNDAFARGRLSRARARTVAGAVAVNPDAEAELLRAAEGNETLLQLRDRASHAKSQARSRQQADAHYQAIRRSRSVRTWTDDEGAFRLSGRFTPDAGASLAASLRAQTDRVFQRARTAGIHESTEAYRADALVALVTGRGIIGAGRGGSTTGTATGTGTTSAAPSSGTPGATSSATPAGDRLDGSTEPGSTGSSGVPTDTSSVPAGTVPAGPAEQATEPAGTVPAGPATPATVPAGPDPRAVVRLTIDLAELGGNTGDHAAMAHFPGIGPVPITAIRELLGEAVYDLVVRNGVDVATVCHLGRAIPVSLQRALDARDPWCVVPGCGRAVGLERDHYVTDYANGGPATMANLARLCAHHHRLRTHQGFQLLGGPGTWRWLAPGQADPGPPGDPPPPEDLQPPGRAQGHGPPDRADHRGPPDTPCTEVPLFTDRE